MAGVAIRNLVKRYGDTVAVNGVSLEAAEGKFLTLLGPSGCGKTTVLRCVAGLITPDAGEIQIGSRVVYETARGDLVPTDVRGIGMVFQSYAIWPHMTVYANVAFGLQIRKVPQAEIKQRVQRALELVRMAGFADRYPRQLSGGQQQRVVLARCLAYEPTVLLLDEPLANLDAALREEMRHELRQIQSETGTTVIAVTHDQAEALAMSDTIAVMNGGVVLQHGTPESIFHKPEHPFVARFLGAPNVLQAEVTTAGLRIEGMGVIVPETMPAPGGQQWLLLRPNLLRLHPPGATGINHFPGRVTRHTFLGDWREYTVAIGPVSLTVREQSGASGFQSGSDVTVEIPFAGQVLFGEAGS